MFCVIEEEFFSSSNCNEADGFRRATLAAFSYYLQFLKKIAANLYYLLSLFHNYENPVKEVKISH